MLSHTVIGETEFSVPADNSLRLITTSFAIVQNHLVVGWSWELLGN
jgi:hypothetical protein